MRPSSGWPARGNLHCGYSPESNVNFFAIRACDAFPNAQDCVFRAAVPARYGHRVDNGCMSQSISTLLQIRGRA